MTAATHPSKQDVKVAVDAVIFTVRDGRLMTLLIQMNKRPFTGRWAFPGGLLGDRQTALAAVRRILREQTGIAPSYLEQLATFDDPGRDPLGRVISMAYFALIPDAGARLRTTAKYTDVRWWPVAGLPALAYDHREIAAAALARLRAKLGYTNIAWSMLPREFTFADLQEVYEAILGRGLDKRNFRKKMMSLGLIAPSGNLARGGSHRPAALFRFRDRRPSFMDIL